MPFVLKVAKENNISLLCRRTVAPSSRLERDNARMEQQLEQLRVEMDAERARRAQMRAKWRSAQPGPVTRYAAEVLRASRRHDAKRRDDLRRIVRGKGQVDVSASVHAVSAQTRLPPLVRTSDEQTREPVRSTSTYTSTSSRVPAVASPTRTRMRMFHVAASRVEESATHCDRESTLANRAPDEVSRHSDSLFEGTYDEEKARQEFQAAVAAWRGETVSKPAVAHGQQQQTKTVSIATEATHDESDTGQLQELERDRCETSDEAAGHAEFFEALEASRVSGISSETQASAKSARVTTQGATSLSEACGASRSLASTQHSHVPAVKLMFTPTMSYREKLLLQRLRDEAAKQTSSANTSPSTSVTATDGTLRSFPTRAPTSSPVESSAACGEWDDTTAGVGLEETQRDSESAADGLHMPEHLASHVNALGRLSVVAESDIAEDDNVFDESQGGDAQESITGSEEERRQWAATTVQRCVRRHQARRQHEAEQTHAEAGGQKVAGEQANDGGCTCEMEENRVSRLANAAEEEVEMEAAARLIQLRFRRLKKHSNQEGAEKVEDHKRPQWEVDRDTMTPPITTACKPQGNATCATTCDTSRVGFASADAAARVIQTTVRRHLRRRNTPRPFMREGERRANNAAQVIQRGFRRYRRRSSAPVIRVQGSSPEIDAEWEEEEGEEEGDEIAKTRDETVETRDETVETRDETVETRDETVESRDEVVKTRDETVETRDETVELTGERLEKRDETVETRKTMDKSPQSFVDKEHSALGSLHPPVSPALSTSSSLRGLRQRRVVHTHPDTALRDSIDSLDSPISSTCASPTNSPSE